VLVIAHRGARDRASENTLAAFEAALAEGVRAIEFDVLVTADGVPIVCHDEHLLRTTGADAYVSQLTSSELRRIPIAVADGEAPARIPTLEEALSSLSGRARLFVELKAVIDPVVGFRASRLAAEAALPLLVNVRDVVVSSFDPSGPAYVRAHSDLPIAHGVSQHAACTPWATTARAAGCVEVHLEAALVDADAIEAASALDLDVLAWTVNDPETAARFAALGVSGIFCDAPGPMMRALAAR
jgi:glycerophosphoryl diester phosphodiesterase